jgi:hypothetical protein
LELGLELRVRERVLKEEKKFQIHAVYLVTIRVRVRG